MHCLTWELYIHYIFFIQHCYGVRCNAGNGVAMGTFYFIFIYQIYILFLRNQWFTDVVVRGGLDGLRRNV